MADNNALVRTALSQSLAITSLDDLVQRRTNDVRYLVCDCSSSMNTPVAYGKNDQRRIDQLRSVVRQVCDQVPLVKVVVFDGQGARLTDKPSEPYGGTPLHEGLRMAKAHGATACVVISDGEPDSEQRAMDAAREFGGRIDVVFCGGEQDYGRLFLRRLAEMTGGTEMLDDFTSVQNTTKSVIGLLTAGDTQQQAAAIALGSGDDEDDDELEDEDDEDEDIDDED